MVEIPANLTMPVRTGPAPGNEIPSHYRWCFGCGSDHPTGLHMTITSGDGLTVVAEFTPADHHQGAPGLAHGGILATAFDEALGSLNWLLAKPAVTGRLECEFKRPVPIGVTLRIDARVLGVSGRKVFVEAEGRLADASGPIAVTASAIFIQVPLEHFITHGDADKVADAIADRAAGGPGWGAGVEVNP